MMSFDLISFTLIEVVEERELQKPLNSSINARPKVLRFFHNLPLN